MATRQEAREASEARLDELHEKLTGAVERLVSGPDWVRALAFAARFRSRSFNNATLIWLQHMEAFEAGRVPEPFPSHVAGYRQWQQLGRQVEKGQPGYMIFAPVTGRFASANPADAESWRRLGKGEKPRAGEVVRSKMVGVWPAYVWDASQTAGDPIPEPPEPRLLEGEAPAGLWDGLAAQVEERGFAVLRVPHEGMIHGANGMTDYTANTVAVREDMDPAAQVKTLAHELGHVLLHGPDADEARQHRGIGEVEAESVALMIGAAHGMDTSGYTIPYVSTWAARVDGKEPVEVVKATGERVRRTALAILDELDTAQVGDGTHRVCNGMQPTARHPHIRDRQPSRLLRGGWRRCLNQVRDPSRCQRSRGGGCDGRARRRLLSAVADERGMAAVGRRARVRPRRSASVPLRPLWEAAGDRAWLPRRHHQPGSDRGVVAAVAGREHRRAHRRRVGRGRSGCGRAWPGRWPRQLRPRRPRRLVKGWELVVRTPTGGMHAYYPATPGSEQRSWQAARAGIDFRGDGGYIIVPPSLRSIEGTTSGYQVEQVNTGPARAMSPTAASTTRAPTHRSCRPRSGTRCRRCSPRTSLPPRPRRSTTTTSKAPSTAGCAGPG